MRQFRKRLYSALFFGMALVAGPAIGGDFHETGLGAGARSLAIGEGGAAGLVGVESLFWNPAGIVGCEVPEFLLGHTAWVEGMASEAGAVVLPLGGLGYLGAEANWQTYPGIEARDEFGELTGTFSLNTGSGSLVWAGRISKYLAVGMGAGFLSQTGVDVIERDIPVSGGIHLDFDEMTMGVAAQGLHSTQPAFNLGASYRLDLGGLGLLLAGGAIMRESENRVGGGAELEAGKMFRIRMGYMVPMKTTELGGFSNLTAGFGFVYNRLNLDYAFLPLGDIGQVHRIQLTLRLADFVPLEELEQ